MLFAASLFFRSFHLHGSNEDPLWEECVVLLQAGDEAEALERATHYGLLAEVAYRNTEADTVSWKFVKVERICTVTAGLKVDSPDLLEKGIEVFSRFLTHAEAQSLLQTANEENG